MEKNNRLTNETQLIYSLPLNQKQIYVIVLIVLKLFHYCTLSPFFTVLVVNLLMAFLAASPRRRYGHCKEKQTLSARSLNNVLYFKIIKCIKFLVFYLTLHVTTYERALKEN